MNEKRLLLAMRRGQLTARIAAQRTALAQHSQALKTLCATGDQVTRYLYGTTLDDSEIARSDLLRKVIYPDSDDPIHLYR